MTTKRSKGPRIANPWNWARCQAVIDVRDGTHDTPKYQPKGIPLVTSKNLVNGTIDFDNAGLISRDDHEQIKKRSAVSRGDILMAMIGTIGNPVIVETDYEFSIKNVALFRTSASRVNTSYFYYLLQSEVIAEQFAEGSKGLTQKFVSLNVLRNLKIPTPPLPVQNRIAAILEKADRLRRLRRYALKLSDTFLQSVFLQMFGDPFTNPNDLDFRSLKSLIRKGDKINYGVVQPGIDHPNGIPIVRVGDFKTIDSSLDSLKRIDPVIEKKYKKSRLQGDEILIACVGSIGKVVLVDARLKGFNIVRAVARVPLNIDVQRFFVATYLKTSFVQRYFNDETRTVSQPTLNIKQIELTPIYVPPKEHQIEFSKVFDRFTLIVNKQREAIRQADHLFGTLLHRAFRGEL